jgi:predicted phosphohydrolase
MRLAWATDTHFDLAEPPAAQAFFDEVKAAHADALLITGDISTGDDVGSCVSWIQSEIGIPLFFVLGNHDYYGSSIGTVRKRMRQLTHRSKDIKWLSALTGPVMLGPNTALVGHDGWYDGGYGDPNTPVELRDFEQIDDFYGLCREERFERMEHLARDAVNHLTRVLLTATQPIPHVIIATHVPPFPETSLYRGERSTPEKLPFYASKMLGELVWDLPYYTAKDATITVLCGHTHAAYDGQPLQDLPQLTVKVGAAEYRHPRLAGVLESS